ncbi:putative phage abortive infection protein [Neisseria mucosa]|uniref:putative phage abortive infection protein n=1 Tax=Neisseria mucosa TaxID=488 RepID=UPI00280B3C48|nr:putative phage abortive infection protein [Neisseria mucosa]
MKPLKNTNEKINKYCTLIFYIFLTILACIGAFYAIFVAYDWKIEKNDFTNWLIAGGTIASAFGLIWFSYLTYKNQKNNEFYSLFKVLLEENNKLLKEIIRPENNNSQISNKYYDLVTLNKHIIDLFEKIFLKDEYKLRNEAQFEINFKEEVVKKIDLHHELKPYLIILFRILKLISTSNKISDDDKKEYYGLIRGLTPPDIQFLILFNSLGYREQEKQPNYKDLLIESRFFEHLPITESWLTRVYLSGLKVVKVKNPLNEEEVKNLASPLKKYISSGKVIDLQAFGQSIYLKQD